MMRRARIFLILFVLCLYGCATTANQLPGGGLEPAENEFEYVEEQEPVFIDDEPAVVESIFTDSEREALEQITEDWAFVESWRVLRAKLKLELTSTERYKTEFSLIQEIVHEDYFSWPFMCRYVDGDFSPIRVRVSDHPDFTWFFLIVRDSDTPIQLIMDGEQRDYAWYAWWFNGEVGGCTITSDTTTAGNPPEPVLIYDYTIVAEKDLTPEDVEIIRNYINNPIKQQDRVSESMEEQNEDGASESAKAWEDFSPEEKFEIEFNFAKEYVKRYAWQQPYRYLLNDTSPMHFQVLEDNRSYTPTWFWGFVRDPDKSIQFSEWDGTLYWWVDGEIGGEMTMEDPREAGVDPVPVLIYDITVVPEKDLTPEDIEIIKHHWGSYPVE